MNKTISTNIGGSVFYIDEDAYNELEAYLKGVKKHFSVYPDSEEIIKDMEARIAERFLESNKAKVNKPIGLSEVKNLISAMGRIEDFESAEPKKPEQESEASKKLMRNPDNQIIAGVSSGLAAYFNTDPLIVRLLFALTLLFGGFGIFLYIVLWIIMPEAKTATEKLQMSGERITLGSVEQQLKEGVNELKSKPGFNKAIRYPAKYYAAFSISSKS
jgi:phage shock protein PspC (stress-responsive transcriptional regulator)